MDNTEPPLVTEEQARRLAEVIASRDPGDAYKLADDIDGSTQINAAQQVAIRTLQQIVVDAKDPELAFHFAWNVDRADIASLQQVVIDAKNGKWAYLFERSIIGSDTTSLGEIVREYGSMNDKDLFQSLLAGRKIGSARSGGR